MLLEQHTKVGGCCHTFKKGGDYEFDSGIHFVGKMNANDGGKGYASMLSRLTGGQLQWQSQGDPYDYVIVDNGASGSNEYRMPVGLDNLQKMLRQRFPNDTPAVDEFCRLLVGILFIFPQKSSARIASRTRCGS